MHCLSSSSLKYFGIFFSASSVNGNDASIGGEVRSSCSLLRMLSVCCNLVRVSIEINALAI